MLLILVATGCAVNSKNEYNPLTQMSFQPVMHIATKADTGLEDYPEGQSFAISAWTLDKKYNWKEHSSLAGLYLNYEPVHFSTDFGSNVYATLNTQRQTALKTFGIDEKHQFYIGIVLMNMVKTVFH